MKILVLGGTRFVGRHLVTAALDRNHQVTLFNRGTHPSPFSSDVETIHGDRHSDLDKLRGRQWDAVIDTSAYLPKAVRAATQLLSDSVDRYVFISSVSVYADLSVAGIEETAPLATLTEAQLDQANGIDASGQTSAITYGKMYGGLKALCEQTIEAVLPNRNLIIRPGVIVGPDDYTDRFTYWVTRVAEGGEVLAPGRTNRSLQFIDGRDLAEWIVLMTERQEAGIYNANVLPDTLTMQDLLEACRAVSMSDASFTWVTEEFLLEEKVTPWSEMPLWMPEEAAPHLKGLMSVDCSRAFSAGLTTRPLNETIADTLNWCATHCSLSNLKAGLKPGKERELLQKWRKSNFKTER